MEILCRTELLIISFCLLRFFDCAMIIEYRICHADLNIQLTGCAKCSHFCILQKKRGVRIAPIA